MLARIALRRGVDRRLYLLSLGNFTVGTGNYGFLGLLAELAADLNVPVGQAGQLAAAFAITFAIAAPILVPATRRLGSRQVLLLSLAGFGVMNIASALAPSFGALFGARIVGAAFACVYAPVAGAVATTMVEADARGKALAAVVAGMVFAFVIGVPLGTFIGGQLGWRATFAFGAICNFVGAVAIFAGISSTGTVPSRKFSFAFLGRWDVTSNFLLVAVVFAGVFIAVAYIGPLLRAITLFNKSGIAALQVVIGIGGAIGTFVGGKLADQRPTREVLAMCFGVAALSMAPFSFLLVGSIPGTAAAILCITVTLFVSSAAGFAVAPILQFRVVRGAADEAQTALAFYFAFFFFGQGIGSAIGGLVIEQVSLTALGWTATAALIAGALLARFGAPEPRPTASETVGEVNERA